MEEDVKLIEMKSPSDLTDQQLKDLFELSMMDSELFQTMREEVVKEMKKRGLPTEPQ